VPGFGRQDSGSLKFDATLPVDSCSSNLKMGAANSLKTLVTINHTTWHKNDNNLHGTGSLKGVTVILDRIHIALKWVIYFTL
jgi:hypothetical protein